MTAASDGWGRAAILEKALVILEEYADTAMTVRQLHYRLVAAGMPNTLQHYKRVVACMTEARWSGEVEMEAFVDRERAMVGETKAEDKDLKEAIEEAEEQIRSWMEQYDIGVWANQPEYVEVWIEKKALQGVFEDPCYDLSVGLAPCKGYPSLTFLNEASERFGSVNKPVVLLYFGDYDPSGEDIPRSLQTNIERMGTDIEVERIALNAEQIAQYRLPGVPAKMTDSRTANWDGGSVVELDAMDPKVLKELCRNAIESHLDEDALHEYNDRRTREGALYRARLKEIVEGIATEGES